MNEEDKKRFARYKKGYIPSLEDEEYLNNTYINNKQTKDNLKQKQVLGYINNVTVNTDTLIKNITNKN
jgi:hypothetical protein